MLTPIARLASCGTAIYHNPEAMDREIEVEAVAPLQATIPESDRVKVATLPAVETMACVVHHGPFATLGQAYTAVLKWIEANGYRISGPSREVYLEYQRGGDQSKYVTEVQFPVEKV